MAKDITYAGGTAGVRAQILPDLKVRPYAQGEIGRVAPSEGGAGQGGNYLRPLPPQAGAPRPGGGVKAGSLYYREGEGSSPPDDDGMAKGGKVKKTIPVKKAVKVRRKRR